MKITARMLTNKALIEIVDALIQSGNLPDKLLLGWYKNGLTEQIISIRRQLEKIAEKAKDKKLTRKEYAVLCRKEQQLVSLGNKKLDLLKRLDDATDSPAK